jgi:(2R)-sulfolactate sulfo-lyase subunit alpha
MNRPDFLAHHRGDDVAVAVHDVAAGPATLAYLDTGQEEASAALENIPLGHKIALRDLESGAPATEYGVQIGVMYKSARAGELVHVHNLRSARWPHSS